MQLHRKKTKWKSEAESALSYFLRDFYCFEKFQAEIILEFNLLLAFKQLIEWSQIPPPCHFILSTFN